MDVQATTEILVIAEGFLKKKKRKRLFWLFGAKRAASHGQRRFSGL